MRLIQTSQIGLVRHKNEDRLLVKQDADLTALLVCDGVGGSRAGDVAASIIVDRFGQSFDQRPLLESLQSIKDWAVLTLEKINWELFQLSHKEDNQQGMSSTGILAILSEYGDFYINVGDSRLYMIDTNSKLVQLSTDHSLVNDLVIKGNISLIEAEHHPLRHAVTNAYGIYAHLRYDLFDITLPYQYLLLCSDGLSGYVDGHMIEEILTDNSLTLNQKDEALSQAVLDNGAYDNFTYIIVEDRHG